MAARSVVVRVGIPTLVTAVLATFGMIAVNIATTESTTGPWAWAAVAIVTLGSAAASLWLYRRTQAVTQHPPPTASTPSLTGSASNVQIRDNAFSGPTAIQAGDGVQINHLGS